MQPVDDSWALRRRAQRDYIRQGPFDLEAGSGFFFQRGHILVRDDAVARATAIIAGLAGRPVDLRPPGSRPDDGRPDDRQPGTRPDGGQPDDTRPDPQPDDRQQDDTRPDPRPGDGRPRDEPPAVVPGHRLLALPLGQGDVPRSTIDVLHLILHGTDREGRRVRLAATPLGDGAASVNHLLHLTHGSGDAGHCPYSEPVPVAPGTPLWPAPESDPEAGAGVRVVVVDTALDEATRDATPWMTGVTGIEDPAAADRAAAALRNDPTGARDDLRYRGHGTFIAGLVRTVAPAATVVVRTLFFHRGAALETEVVDTLRTVLAEDHPDVICLSSGTYTFDDNGLLGLAAFNESRLRHHKGVVLVAAAGNDASHGPFWPAAAPFAVAAGALDATLDQRAVFSNHGGWVDVYAPGTDVINAYPSGPYVYQERQPGEGPMSVVFTGLASWSGTSFATPIVAGLVAARMSQTGENGRTAAGALIRIGQQRAIPGVGAVLIPRG
ncbi:S8 family serine peptidase [Actinoplanes sp. NBRC 101535]|uniref:S8/S53 family peptidase n=1 Tax=Actinoplanes sp. NBRC 101535 TaxID=3032196 RepID=UPI0024A4ACEE|nr:S8 family serine peptidase [Actinoplanes sp. NBRC 101535]GLY00508.1 hypothetical protein Acsp01_08870 [Actinoplanes sp. NBRC 101535]